MPPYSRGSRRDLAALEARRFGAAERFAHGESHAAVARALGVTTAASNHWHLAWQVSGRPGLKVADQAGGKPPLMPAQGVRIDRALRAGPQAQGFSTALWTLAGVAVAIAQWKSRRWV